MRKKLLALLMCATMVLGTAVTSSAATLVEADYKAADTIIGQYNYFAGEFNNGKFGEETKQQITFMTNFEAIGGTTAQYKYAFKVPALDDTDATDYVKVNKDGKPFVKVGTDVPEITASVDSTTVGGVRQIIVNASIDAPTLVKAVDGGKDHYYYVSAATPNKANEDVKGKTIAVVGNPINASVIATAATAEVLTLTEYAPTDKTSISEYVVAPYALQDSYGVDVDGYIPLTGDKNTTWSLYSTVSKGYYVDVTKASADKVDIANAFHDGLISKDAVAVHLDFYKLDTAAVPVLSYAGQVANQSVMQQVRYCAASREETPVTLTTDWLSRTNLKSASGVSAYILDEFVPSIANTFTRVGSLVKVADVADGKFTADYVISGTYIFDVAAAADNAGQADADTKTPATDTTSSPKTGDVAPIAALAVVMMGAFGAMVVASKKRA